MSPNRHSIEAVSTAKKFKTPLKASVVLLTSMILAACNTTDDPSYNLEDIFSPSQSVIDAQLKAEKEKAEKAKAEAHAAVAAKEKAEAALVAAEKAALEAKKESDAAIAAAEKAKKEAEDALEDALASGGGGNKEELQKIADEKAKLAKEAQADAETAQNAAQAAQKIAQDAAAAAEIKNAPETAKSGVQSLNIDPKAAGIESAFTVTTRDFKSTDSSIEARADSASGDLLPIVNITTSGKDDTDLQNGFKSHDDRIDITTGLGVLPLTYISVYKDYGNDLRIGHIDGAAALGANQLPVNGVAVIGNATQAASMPTEGKVGYTGDATYRKLGIGNAIEFGSSVFTADFVAKNVKGDLTFAKAGKIGLTAGITGNQFSGAAADNAGYNTEGGFFGGDAQYLGGVYEGNGAQGTYGAKSDKQIQADNVASESADKAAAANKALADAQAAAAKAKKDAERAQAAADNAGNAGDGQALQDALDELEAAKKAEETAKQEAQTAIQKAADKAKEEVELAQQDAEQAKKDAEQAKRDADNAIAEAESAADDRVEEANSKAQEAQDKVLKAEQAQRDAEAARTEAEKKAQGLQELLDTFKTGVQHLSIDASALKQGVKTTTTRDFEIRSTSDVDARADLALTGVLPGPITIQVSGDNDAETENGFKAYEGTGNVTGKGDLAYIATYKDFGANGEMRIAHIDGTAANGAVPVDGVAVVGNKTATLPSEGTFEYAGDATNRKVGVDNAVKFGSSEFTADFVARKVDGTLKFDKTEDIILSANIGGEDIEDNEFSGEKNGYNTNGAFYGKDANFIGGIYEGNGSQGTFGAEKQKQQDPNPETPVNPDIKPADPNMTGFQSTAMSSLEANSSDLKKFEDAIGYVAIRDDASDFTETETKNGSEVPKDNRKGNNFTSFDKGVVRGDMVQPASVKAPIAVNLTTDKPATVKVDAGLGDFLNPDFKYNAVYENFGEQMRVGHVYGVLNSSVLRTDVSRVANVYVQGHLTNQADIDFLKGVNEGKVTYEGNATYMENIHLGDTGAFEPVNGTSNFNVDFVNNSVEGKLSFEGDFKYNPTGKIDINATIDGNTFAGNHNDIDTAGGFYGQDAQFLGGIYQDASTLEGTSGGKGAGPGTGTKFQGTFGAEKQ